MDLSFFLEQATTFLQESPKNRVQELGIDAIYSPPLFAVAAADDPLFSELKNPAVIGPHHRTPQEWLPGAQSVLSYFLPFSSFIRDRNKAPGLPAIEWVYGRYEGEQVNDALREHLVSLVEQQGGRALAPPLSSQFQVVDRRSNYSERHVAFIAGLGTFGLGRSLITSRGCAGRFGSVVLSMEIKATPRPYQHREDYCNHCGECIPRCPVGAITSKGKDLEICAQYSRETIRPRFKPRYGCGKCQTDVACESRIPDETIP